MLERVKNNISGNFLEKYSEKYLSTGVIVIME